MNRQQTSAEHLDVIWATLFRRCRIDEERVEINAPLLCGKSFVFDGTARVVTIRQHLLKMCVRWEEIPLEYVSIRLRKRKEGADIYSSYASEPITRRKDIYFVEMTIAENSEVEEVEVCAVGTVPDKGNLIVNAIRGVLPMSDFGSEHEWTPPDQESLYQTTMVVASDLAKGVDKKAIAQRLVTCSGWPEEAAIGFVDQVEQERSEHQPEEEPGPRKRRS